jgi:hypothetical protein
MNMTVTVVLQALAQPKGGRNMSDNDFRREPIEVVLPDEPPGLTPGAARALLRILVKAYEQEAGDASEVPAASETPDS